MRSENEVISMFEKHKARCLQKRMKEYLSCKPRNCKHNQRLRVKNKGMVGICQCPQVLKESKEPLFVCDTDEVAQGCPYFSCKNTRESVVDSFENVLSSPTRCGEEYPKLAALIWVLMKGKFEISPRCGYFTLLGIKLRRLFSHRR